MKIAQIATVETPVSPTKAGSIEHLIWTLTEQLLALGHEVTVFGTADSQTSAPLIAVLEAGYGTAAGSIGDWIACEWMNLCAAVEMASRFDVLHSHAYLYGLPLTRLAGRPFVHTHHVAVHQDQYEIARRYPEASITAISGYQWSEYPDISLLATIHHGVDTSLFAFQPEPHDYLCFLGRLIPEKGPHLAIEVARRTGIPLLIAAEPTEFYVEQIQPLVDGQHIRYVGPVYGAAKSQLLGGARALIYPLEAPEPFGLVMIEAMLCGTPVAALDIGAVPEVIDAGVTGYHAPSLDGLVAFLPQVMQLDRQSVRRRAEQRFSARRMAADYAAAFARIVS
jgi:glycosyltransferase involved in cell wall biosynthesis